MSKDDYEVGFRKPPKHTRYVPGESGNKGRKKKRPEFQAEIIARIRDEVVTVNGKSMTMFEMAVRSVIHNTIKRGHSRDLKTLLELLNQYGAVPKVEAAAVSLEEGQRVVNQIFEYFERTNDIDPEDVLALDKLAAGEASIVMKCANCSPTLRQLWNLPTRKALGERYGCSGLQRDVEKMNEANN